MRVPFLAAIAAIFISGCGTGIALPPHPTPTHPAAMCSISCTSGRVIFSRQHLCVGGKRQFEELPHVIGEFIHRNEADGVVELAVWIACIDGYRADGRCATTADFPKANVEPTTCASFISQLIASRPAEQRGVFPGEDASGHPSH
jgi:hypothetical protein